MGTILLRLIPIHLKSPKWLKAPGYGYCDRPYISILSNLLIWARYLWVLLSTATPSGIPFGIPDCLPGRSVIQYFR